MPTPIARYYIDEAASGQAPPAVLDFEAAPEDLTTVYVGDTPSYTAIASGRGLEYPTQVDGQDSGSFSDVLSGGNKIFDAINTTQTATLEIVVDVPQSVIDGGNFFRCIFGIVRDDFENDPLLLWYNGFSGLIFDVTGPGGVYREYLYTITAGLYVMHAVFDSTEGTPINRMRLYINGTFFASTDQPSGTIPLNMAVEIPTAQSHRAVLGGVVDPVPGLNASWDGALYYAVIYDVAFTAAEAAAAAAVLAANNDPEAESEAVITETQSAQTESVQVETVSDVTITETQSAQTESVQVETVSDIVITETQSAQTEGIEVEVEDNVSDVVITETQSAQTESIQVETAVDVVITETQSAQTESIEVDVVPIPPPPPTGNFPLSGRSVCTDLQRLYRQRRL